VKRRLKALKRLQFESTKVEAKFYEEYHALEMKYQSLYQPFREKVLTLLKLFLAKIEALWLLIGHMIAAIFRPNNLGNQMVLIVSQVDLIITLVSIN
jgi:Nucleosome assembly protein (NAP)